MIRYIILSMLCSCALSPAYYTLPVDSHIQHVFGYCLPVEIVHTKDTAFLRAQFESEPCTQALEHCTYGQTDFQADLKVATVFYSSTLSLSARLATLAHELYHIELYCTTGDPDAEHRADGWADYP